MKGGRWTVPSFPAALLVPTTKQSLPSRERSGSDRAIAPRKQTICFGEATGVYLITHRPSPRLLKSPGVNAQSSKVQAANSSRSSNGGSSSALIMGTAAAAFPSAVLSFEAAAPPVADPEAAPSLVGRYSMKPLPFDGVAPSTAFPTVAGASFCPARIR